MATDWLLVFRNNQIIEQFHVTSGHVRKDGHFVVPNQSCGRWTFNLCKNFLLYQYIYKSAGHVSDNALL